MANGGLWGTNPLPKRPGMYINFTERANLQIVSGPRGTVGMPIFDYTGGNLEEGKFLTIRSEDEAIKAVGEINAKSVTAALAIGAERVLIYGVPAKTLEEFDYEGIRTAYESRIFDVFVYPQAVSATEKEAVKAWVKRNREEGKHFAFVTGGSATDDQDSTIGNARSVLLADEYVINLINGGVDSEGAEIPSEEYAVRIAGLIAGTAINKSITYATLPVTDVNKRLTNSETIEALNSGSLVLTNDGGAVRVEQGITTASTEFIKKKIRAMRARQAIATDLPALAKAHFIGKLDNEPVGQKLLLAAISQYLETLALNRVIRENFYAGLDPEYKSEGDCVFLVIDAVEVDSMERIFVDFRL